MRRGFGAAQINVVYGIFPCLVAAKVNKKNQKASFLYNFAKLNAGTQQ
jgi:hypothetical protein